VATLKENGRRVLEVLREVKALAREYYLLTGRPLGITGEVAEFEAARILGIQLSPTRRKGYDAVRVMVGGEARLQIKGRCFPSDSKKTQRLGGIKLDCEWDAVLMVILDPDFDAREIWEAERTQIELALSKPGSLSRNVRGALAVSQFKRIGRRLWERKDG
jgi:hypothetical protein